MNKLVATELKTIRIRKGLSLEKVAENIGVCYETMRKYENGKTNISIEFLEKLLNYYDVNMFIFFKTLCENMHVISQNN